MTAPAPAAPITQVPTGPEVGTAPRAAGAGALRVPSGGKPAQSWSSWRSEAWLAIGVVTIIALLVVPLPATVLDGFLAVSIALAIVVLLVTLSTADPVDFSIFPSLLLLLTLFRLGLNVSSTRLILSRGSAGNVIAAFGDAVIGGNYVVGLVIFLILVVINFMVITKGAGRIAEVAARFTLDAMPGRQMSIDADLNAGLIDETEARRRREDITRYADFYGAMDGAAKFVRGDAVAGLVITAINLIGGFVIGMTQAGLSAPQALQRYATLTVGDGLVTQIPALIVSTSAGMIVTYGSTNSQIGPTLAHQLTRHPRAMFTASGILVAFGLVPGLPPLPFLTLAGPAGLLGAYARARSRLEATAEAEMLPTTGESDSAPYHNLLQVDPLELEVGYSLVPLIDEQPRGDLLQRISVIRKQVALELGMIVPPVRIRDNIQLPSTEYRIKLRGATVARGEVLPGYVLALNTSGSSESLEGIQTTDPSFGMPAAWVVPDRRIDAESHGYAVVEAPTVLATHLMETIKQNAGDLLGRQETQELLDALKQHNPALVDDVVPGKLTLGTLHRVLQRLLREGIPVRDLVTILEALADATDQTKDAELLTEHARRALSKTIVRLFEDADGTIRGITIGPRLEAALMRLFGPASPADVALALEPNELSAALRALGELAEQHRTDGRRRPLITPPTLRVGVRRLLEPVLPQVPVISLGELPPRVPIQSLATWELDRDA